MYFIQRYAHFVADPNAAAALIAWSGAIARVGIGNTPLLLMLLHWGSGFASGVVDNIPMALAMAYVLKNLAATVGAPALAIMTWALALGIDIGGNMTPVGASANVVAYTYMERTLGKVGWGRWIKLAVPVLLGRADREMPTSRSCSDQHATDTGACPAINVDTPGRMANEKSGVCFTGNPHHAETGSARGLAERHKGRSDSRNARLLFPLSRGSLAVVAGHSSEL